MSSLFGLPDERWSLTRAVDALVDSARQAGSPGLIWIAGILYPSILLGPGSGWESFMAHLGFEGLQLLQQSPQSGIALLPLVLLFVRLTMGLARISAPEAWQAARGSRRRPRLSDAWKAGKGLTLSACGLWLQLVLMMMGALLIALGPAYFVRNSLGGGNGEPHEIFFSVVIVGPLVTALALYTLVLSVLAQLSLHSLIQNRRGVGSALIHAWRMVRNAPWATGRAILVDFVLALSVAAIGFALRRGLSFTGMAELAWLVIGALTGFAGVARAGYWARAYRALGGLSPDDGVPGLASAGDESEALASEPRAGTGSEGQPGSAPTGTAQGV